MKQRSRRRIIICVLAALVAVVLADQAEASPLVYLRSTVGPPWGVGPGDPGSNEAAMNLAFGAGNWDDSRYETVDVGTLFSPATSFIFMEGGDSNANEMEAFLTANQAAMEAWVAGGGHIFLNAAPNEGNGMSYGFGVTLIYPEFGGAATGTAVNPLHPIFNGPHVPAGPAYTGDFFSHSIVVGAGLTPLIMDGTGDATLAEMNFGAGLALFGGMTLPFFHDPDPNGYNLRANILEYAAQPVPEPATLALIGFGLIGLAGRRLRRK